MLVRLYLRDLWQGFYALRYGNVWDLWPGFYAFGFWNVWNFLTQSVLFLILSQVYSNIFLLFFNIEVFKLNRKLNVALNGGESLMELSFPLFEWALLSCGLFRNIVAWRLDLLNSVISVWHCILFLNFKFLIDRHYFCFLCK